MSQTMVVCPGATKEHPHNLKIIDPSTGSLICDYFRMDPHTHEATYICPFMYRDKHKVDTWRSNYNSATGKYEK